jgi:hypothetical protein
MCSDLAAQRRNGRAGFVSVGGSGGCGGGWRRRLTGWLEIKTARE